MENTFRTIEKLSTGLFKDKGSKFLSFAYPVSTEDEIKDIISGIRKDHRTARHCCYAWRLGTDEITFRANDDGEPSSTAGKPILGQILSFNLTNILIVVVRYFGGILLGTSRLINAYKSALYEALTNADIIVRSIEKMYELAFSFDLMNKVMSLVKKENLHIIESQFESQCRLLISVCISDCEKVESRFDNIHGLQYSKK